MNLKVPIIGQICKSWLTHPVLSMLSQNPPHSLASQGSGSWRFCSLYYDCGRGDYWWGVPPAQRGCLLTAEHPVEAKKGFLATPKGNVWQTRTRILKKEHKQHFSYSMWIRLFFKLVVILINATEQKERTI